MCLESLLVAGFHAVAACKHATAVADDRVNMQPVADDPVNMQQTDISCNRVNVTFTVSICRGFYYGEPEHEVEV